MPSYFHGERCADTQAERVREHVRGADKSGTGKVGKAKLLMYM